MYKDETPKRKALAAKSVRKPLASVKKEVSALHKSSTFQSALLKTPKQGSLQIQRSKDVDMKIQRK